MAKTKRRNINVRKLSKKKYVYGQGGGLNKSPLNDVVLNSPIYNDEDEWEKDNYTPGRIIRLVATLTGSVLVSGGAIIYSSRHLM
tara:strand:+ start:2338 stop:2592 length:255 start_codon:yes stop_codon:yes gene_type:complete